MLIIAQQIANLVTYAENATAQIRTYSKQTSEILALISNVLRETNQREYQELINQLIISKTKFHYAADCLVGVSKSGNDWLREHISNNSNGTTVPNGYVDTEVQSEANTPEEPFKPTRKTPRDLPVSQYGFTKDASGMETYDSPLEVDQYLYAEQGSAYDNFKGTCGLCSCANVLRLAGVNYGEKEMIDYAAKQQGGFFATRLCTVNPFNPSASGGTTPKQRQQILDNFGVSSSIFDVKTDADGKTCIDTINDLAKWVSEGRGVIIDVDAGLFYNSPQNYGKGHAVTLTSVEKNKYGDITAFYILDSNQGTVKCNGWKLQDMLRNFVGINVTSQIIR